MNCHEVKQSIYTYLDGQLPAPQERSLYLHLAGCNPCQGEVGRARQLNRLLEVSCTPVDPPPAFVDMVMGRLALADAPPAAVSCPAQREMPKPRGWRRLAGAFSRWEGKSLMVAGYLVFFLAVGTLFVQGQKLAGRDPGPVNPPDDTRVVFVDNPGTPVNPAAGNPDVQTNPATPENSDVTGENTPGPDNTPVTNPGVVVPPVTDTGKDGPQPGTTSPGPAGNAGDKSTVPADTKTPDIPPADDFNMTLPSLPGKVQIATPMPEGNVRLDPLVTDGNFSNVKPVWSPDFKEIWFLSQKDAPTGTYIPWKVSPDGQQLKPVVLREGGFPLAYGGGAWSPGRNSIAYVQEKDGYLQIMVDDLKGRATSVTPDGTGEVAQQRRTGNATDYWAYWPVWSPKGELAYLTTRYDNLDIMVIDVEGNTRALTQTPAQEMYPAWSPDGGKLAFYRSQRDEAGNRTDLVFVMDKNGGEVPVTPPMGADSLVPAWSPDGKRLAINVGFTEPQAGARQRGLWLVNADGTGLVMVYDQGGGRLVNWSPDGKKVAFNDAAGKLYVLLLSDQPGKYEVLNVTSSADVGGMSVTWSRDSQQLLFDWAKPGESTRGIYVAKLPDSKPNP